MKLNFCEIFTQYFDLFLGHHFCSETPSSFARYSTNPLQNFEAQNKPLHDVVDGRKCADERKRDTRYKSKGPILISAGKKL